ncbi:MAG: glycosyltransferase family 2 protein [Paracoccaceae bacterium]
MSWFWCLFRMSILQRPPPFVLPQTKRCDLLPAALGSPDARALDRIGIETALRNHILPLTPAGAVTPVAATSHAAFRRMEPHLRARLGPVAPRIASEAAIEGALLTMRQAHLARRAERRTPDAESCRTWSRARLGLVLGLVALVVLALAWLRQDILLWGLIGWAVLTLVAVTGLRVTAALTQLWHLRRDSRAWRSMRGRTAPTAERLPPMSLLVPLYKERDIAARLVKRLSALDYPRDRLEVALILEWGDQTTEMALRAARLPDWMRIIRVPSGTLRTKPRAMNYAMDFLSGEIVGIYDAEDAPARTQLLDVATMFEKAPLNVACVQGALDFYNAKTNWLTRCFTIDYAVWFRLILPGFARLGFVLPLGGTTVFFRRSALESLGRWDAHNVTEDADLGLRLARHGYRCAVLPSVTEEEATATVPAWLRQRSRWIKGYAMTWAAHMRDPLRLYGELGLARFIGVQILFLGTLSQFLLAPLLWSFWLILFGLPHPFLAVAPWSVVVGLASLFFYCELATMFTAAMAVARPKHRWLIKWVPLMHFYYPLAAVASWKGFAELLSHPFYWDKTAHGKERRRRGALNHLKDLVARCAPTRWGGSASPDPSGIFSDR